ncbi:MAG TPA: hypothetical protein VJ997_10700 [Longimicrobiales bacterium]|nr:hypothetical protein [Longimicrobiales bacterium]
MHALLDRIVTFTSWWADLYADSRALEASVMFLHLGGMVAAGGLAFTLDRAVFRSRKGWPHRDDLAKELHASHGAVIGGLVVVFASGIVLTASDPEAFLTSWIYWAKMVTVVLLLGNGWLLKKSGERLLEDPQSEGAFRSLRRSALRSAGLWALSVLGGIAITLYA